MVELFFYFEKKGKEQKGSYREVKGTLASNIEEYGPLSFKFPSIPFNFPSTSERKVSKANITSNRQWTTKKPH